jgi:hypothetical protein
VTFHATFSPLETAFITASIVSGLAHVFSSIVFAHLNHVEGLSAFHTFLTVSHILPIVNQAFCVRGSQTVSTADEMNFQAHHLNHHLVAA